MIFEIYKNFWCIFVLLKREGQKDGQGQKKESILCSGYSLKTDKSALFLFCSVCVFETILNIDMISGSL